MNRSTRQTTSKQIKLNPSLSSSSLSSDNSSSTSISPSLESLGISSGHSPILPKPPVSEEYFPELANNNKRVSKDTFEEDGISLGSPGFILPDPLPPLPPSLTKVYNTRKRSHENFNEPSKPTTTNSMASAASSSSSIKSESARSANAKPVTIPGFVSKLYRMVDESTSNLIKWGQDGKSFVVTRPEDFSRQVLPLFFKHNNFSSFVRQLNMYGFHKVPHLQQGTMAASSVGTNISTIWEFSHSNFIRNHPELLLNVRRKIGKEDDGNGMGSGASSTTMSPALSSISEASRLTAAASDDFLVTARNLRQELQFIHQQQQALRTDLASIQRDNQLLWNENLASRERHLQQQQVIDRILRFLASVFTADGKLLSGNGPNAFAALQNNLAGGATSSVAASAASSRQRPLLLGNVSGNEDELRRQVLELISGGDLSTTTGSNSSSGKIDLLPNDAEGFLINFNGNSSMASTAATDNNNTNTTVNNIVIDPIERIEDLDSTVKGMSNDISLVDEEISKVLNTSTLGENPEETTPTFDDVDFSSYLNCQSLE